MTPIFKAAELGHAACLELLVKAGADYNHRDNVCTYHHHLMNLSFIILNYSLCCDVLKLMKTSLMIAANGGHEDCVKILLKAGANPLLTDSVCTLVRAFITYFS